MDLPAAARRQLGIIGNPAGLIACATIKQQGAAGPFRGAFLFSWSFRIIQPVGSESIRRAHVECKRLVTWPMASRSHACACWLSSRRGQIIAASIGLGERDSRWKTR